MVLVDTKAAIRQAIALFQEGKLVPAGERCREITALDPDHAEAIHLLGVMAYQSGRHRDALDLIGRAIELNAKSPQFYNNAGLNHLALGDPQQAIRCYQRAIALDPNFIVSHMNLGNILKDLGRLDEALTQFHRVIAIDANHSHAHSCIGVVLAQQGNFGEAMAYHRRALSISPNDAEAHNNIGVAYKQQAMVADALAHYRRAAELDPTLFNAHSNLAVTLFEMGEAIPALAAARRALSLKETVATRETFARCAASLTAIPDTGPEFCGLLVRALAEPWYRPTELARVGVACLKVDPVIRKCMDAVGTAWPKRPSRGQLFGSSRLDEVSRNALLLTVLKSTQVCDPEFERFLTAMRFALLQTAEGDARPGQTKQSAWRLYSALAQQCFINGYIFAWTDEEREQAMSLRNKLEAALKSGADVPLLWPVAVASYFPLHVLDGANALLTRTWHDSVDAMLTQQVREPQQEAELRKEIPRITPIANDVSTRVRDFYEENLYPCWVRSVAVSRVENPRPGAQERQSILIAGCGTGQNVFETATAYTNVDVLAVDLSLSSLAYALRKTREAGLDNIRYAQADILELGSLDQRFELIEALGVLHHTSDPSKGWRVLLSLLRPGGYMRVGLYSELGRRRVSAAQAFFAQRGYGDSVDDIRRGRHDMWAAGEGDALLQSLGRCADFFTLGMCRDLLFHVQERRFTIPQIKDFLAENNVSFAGFILPGRVMAQYRSQFPQDRTATDLDLWHLYETRNPDTFTGMYQFWIRST